MMPHSPNYAPRIAIIGAGPSGLTTAKNLQQQGLQHITVFEKHHTLGGNWAFDPQGTHGSVYETTHTISSKRLSRFDDFPMPSDYPDYPSHTQILAYFKAYAERFGIMPFIRFNTRVERAEALDAGWQITYRNPNNEIEQAFFDYLFVANGHHSSPHLPAYPGAFSGEILHSHQYKSASAFKDKRVLVVGVGNSACDLAVEVSRVATFTAISVREGHHIFPKFIFGKPTDVAFAMIRWMPRWSQQLLSRMVIRVIQGRYAKYRLPAPEGRPLDKHPTINSELLYAIRHGRITPYRGIDHFNGHAVYFKNGQVISFDTVIFATGYTPDFPFLSPEWNPIVEAGPCHLYRKMMHPTRADLFFIGLFQPQGSIWPLADYQAKLAAGMITGRFERPQDLSRKMAQEIRALKCHFNENVASLEVDYHRFRDQLIKDLAQQVCEHSD